MFVDENRQVFLLAERVVLRRVLAGDGLEPLLAMLGVKRGFGVLASTQRIVAINNNKIDRLNITTNAFSSHPSTAVLADGGTRVFASMGVGLELIPNSEAKVTKTVRAQATT